MRILINPLMRALFYPAPGLRVSEEEARQFEDLYERAMRQPNEIIDYRLPAPKHKFLQYIARHKPIVFHGSNHPGITRFEPRPQTLFDGQADAAVFASKDPIWSAFYAVLDKEKLHGNFRNGSLSVDGKRWFHFYSLTKATAAGGPWTSGMMYFLPEEAFTYIGRGPVRFNEWISREPVTPLARLPIHPDDFIFRNRVAVHKPDEPMAATWLLYKFRTRFRRNPRV